MLTKVLLATALAGTAAGFSIRPTVTATDAPTDPPPTPTDLPTLPPTDAPTEPATEPPTEDPLTKVYEVTFSDYSRTATCAGTALRSNNCYTAGGRSYRFGCRMGSNSVLTDVCSQGCSSCNNNWSNEGETIDTCYDDGTALFQYSCSAPAPEEPVIPTAAVDPEPAEPSNPTEGPKEEARLTCAELGWLPDGGSTKVCAASRVYPTSATQCSGQTNFFSANGICKAIGARLCTSAELSNDEAVGTGCKYDDARIWTATHCDEGRGRITQAGARKGLRNHPVECTAPTARTGAVRCCADVTAGSSAQPSGAADINGYPSGYGPAFSKEYRLADGTCGANVELRSSSCWVDSNGVANRFACAAGEPTVWYQSCGTDATCSPSSCSGDWATDGERVGDCYSSRSFFYQYECNV